MNKEGLVGFTSIYLGKGVSFLCWLLPQVVGGGRVSHLDWEGKYSDATVIHRSVVEMKVSV